LANSMEPNSSCGGEVAAAASPYTYTCTYIPSRTHTTSHRGDHGITYLVPGSVTLEYKECESPARGGPPKRQLFIHALTVTIAKGANVHFPDNVDVHTTYTCAHTYTSYTYIHIHAHRNSVVASTVLHPPKLPWLAKHSRRHCRLILH
jgi:hypothetical protein